MSSHLFSLSRIREALDQDTEILLIIGDISVVQNLWVAGQTHRAVKHGIPPELDHIDQRHKYQEYLSTYPY